MAPSWMPTRPRWSLRSRLLAIAVMSAVTAWFAGAAAIYYVMQREGALLFDARLSDLAQTVLVFADHEIREIEATGDALPNHVDTEGTASGRYRYQIWSRGGQLVLASANAPQDTPLMPLADSGWATRTVGGEVWRVVTVVGPDGRYRIQAAESVDERLEMAGLFSRYLATAVGLSALVLSVIGMLFLRLALRPVNAVTAHLCERGPADLRAVDLQQLPAELGPMLEATNRMMGRLDVALRSERGFVAAAAHELRTPLAGLRAQAQLAAHPRTDEPTRQAALLAVQEGVDRAAHLVGQLLDLARSDALAGDPARMREDRQLVPVRQVLERVMSELGPQLAARGLQLNQTFEVPLVSGSDFGIGLILRNLLANAAAHARLQGTVAVSTRLQGDRVVLSVEEDGPGVPEAQRERLFERFYRVSGDDSTGCGLGLSIVKALAQAHGAEVELADSPLGGLAVRVSFPA